MGRHDRLAAAPAVGSNHFRLTGAARELAKTLTPNEAMHGGVVNGQPMDPVSYLLFGLEARFAQLADETRLAAMNELTTFQRKSHESTNAVLARYQLVRQRVNADGGFVMSVEACALQLLRVPP